ncbi:MAG: nuclear transport factor 2 family protein [Myxococcota bacterium]
MSHLDVLRSAFSAMARGDADATVAHYTTDYVIEFPYPVARGAFKVEGRDTVRDYLARAFRVFRFELTIDVVHPSGDPDLVIAEYHGRGRALATGKPYDNRYVGFWWFRGDAVCRTREYYDQGVADAALAP